MKTYRKSLYLLLSAPALLVAVAACKPTEANYRAAYEASLAKREAQDAEMREFGIVLREGDPQWRAVGSDSILYRREPLAALEKDTARMHPYNVVIASYSMPTNARAHAERLAGEGFKSRVLQNGDSRYYTVVAEFDSLPGVPAFVREYVSKHPRDMYSGLPGYPMVAVPTSFSLSY